MALLYSLTGATLHEEPGYPPFRPAAELGGAFDFPDDLSDRLHRFHLRGRKQWEDGDERRDRLHGEEAARNSDPRTLYAAVAELLGLAKQASAVRQDASSGGDGAAEASAARARPAARAAGK